MRRQILFLLLAWTSFSVANGQETLTVAQDGSGDFTTIQAAIDAAPVGEKTTIHIHEGVYTEQVVIGSKTVPSGKIISLIGDGIDKTIITSKAGMAAGFRFDKSPVEAQYSACQAIFDQYGFPLETGGIKVADVDSTIAKYQEELDAAGYQDVLKEFQNQYTKWKG